MTLGGEQTVSQTTTLNADLGVDIDGIMIGGGASTSNTTSTTESKTVSYTVPPRRQAVFVSGMNHKSETGNLQVNYGDRQFGHFIVSIAPADLENVSDRRNSGSLRRLLRGSRPSRMTSSSMCTSPPVVRHYVFTPRH